MSTINQLHKVYSRRRPADSTAVYQRVAAEQLLAERQVTLDQLRRQGCLTLDVPANELSIKVINQYLGSNPNTV